MSLPRLNLALLLLSSLGVGLGAGCSLEVNPADQASLEQPSGTLQFETPEVIDDLLPGYAAELKVRYVVPNPLTAQGVQVRFDIVATKEQDESGPRDPTAVPPGASLTLPIPTTHESGLARTVLLVGSTAGDFRVRASSEHAEPIFFVVHVGDALSPELSVRVDYQGKRELALRTVTMLPSMSCEQALAADELGENVHSYPEADRVVTFDGLGPDLTYAVVALGRDAAGAQLASGCEMFHAPLTSRLDKAQDAIVLTLTDLPMRVMGSYDVVLDLDLAASVERLAESVRGAALANLPATATPEADLFLDALASQLAGVEGAAASLTAQRADGSLAQSLEKVLSAGSTGHVAAGAALASLVSQAGARLVMGATCGVGAPTVPLTFGIDSLRAHSIDGVLAFDLAALAQYNAPAATIEAEYDDTRAVIDMSTLSISLPLGGYGLSLLAALEEKQADWPLTPLAGPAGCEIWSTWLDQQASLTALCDETCASAVCPAVLQQLLASVRGALPALDVDHAAINLRGTLAAHDRGGDGLVDDLGPGSEPLVGNWGKAADAMDEDMVQGDLSPPAQTPLTL